MPNSPSSLPNSLFNNFILRICASILLARLLILNFFPDNFIYTKERLSDLIIAGLILITALIVIVQKLKTKQSCIKTIFDLPCWLLLTALSLSLIHSADFSVSINAFIPFISGLFLFYILVNILQDLKSMFDFWNYLICAICVVIIFGAWEYLTIPMPDIGSTHRIGSVFGFPNVLAGFLMLVIPFIWASFVLAQNKFQKILCGILLIGSLSIFVLTFSFLCTINFFITTLILSPLIFKNIFKNSTLKMSYFFLAIIFLAIFLIVFNTRHDLSITARFEYLRTCFLLLKDNPLSGFGLNTFDLVNRQYVTHHSGYSAYVHNSYLQFWVETGILGFTAIILLVFTFIKQSLKALKAEKDHQQSVVLIAFIWSISSFFIDNMTNFTLLRSSVYPFAFAILGAYCVFLNLTLLKTNSHQQFPKINLAFVSILILILLFVIIKITLGLINYNRGCNLFAEQKINESSIYYQLAAEFDPLEFRYPSALARCSVILYFRNKDKSSLDSAEDYLLAAAKLSPYSVNTYYNLSSIQLEKNNRNKAQDYLNQAQKLNPQAYSNNNFK